tara:strand:- start:837 stop:1412 length:576 start_codon:yes stop_codon:yes gene_type:complete
MITVNDIKIALGIMLAVLFFIGGCEYGVSTVDPCPDIIHVATTTTKTTQAIDSIHKPIPVKTDPPKIPSHPSASIENAPPLVSVIDDSIRTYDSYFVDSVVRVKSTVQGVLLSQDVTVNKTEVTIKDSTIIPYVPPKNIPERYRLKPFAYTVIAQNVGLGLGGMVQTPRNTFIGGYDLINKSILIGVGIKL